MRSDLAERLLEALMDWDIARFSTEVARLQMLASLKYDEYGGYTPGVKFAENLARWLEQFEMGERDVAYRFVMERLVFVSAIELSHLIDITYPDRLEQRLTAIAAGEAGLQKYQVAAVRRTPEFLTLRRRCLFLGLSDGARMDQLRRASKLSHEQFSQDYTAADDQLERMVSELGKALNTQELSADASFRQVFLVDDFAGSGRTLIRPDDENPGQWKGKLIRFRDRLTELQESRMVSNPCAVGVVLYIASEQALDHVKESLGAAGLDDWTVDVIQVISKRVRVDVTDPEMSALCRVYYDPSTEDAHKKETPIGYDDCALPLVLSHNTPNNSICLLWAETSEETGLGRRALFQRYERHHKDRP